jgi:hypothetical protein
MPKRLPLKELLLLAIPAVGLLTVGYYLKLRPQGEHPWNHAGDSGGPWRAVFDGYTLEPVTPPEAWAGYDCKIKLKLHQAGAPSNVSAAAARGVTVNGDLSLNWNLANKPHRIPVSDRDSFANNGGLPDEKGSLLKCIGYEFPGKGQQITRSPLVYLVDLDVLPPRETVHFEGNCQFTTEKRNRPTGLPPGVRAMPPVGKGQWRIISNPAKVDIAFQPEEFRKLLSPVDRSTPAVSIEEVGHKSPRKAGLDRISDGDTTVTFTVSSKLLGDRSPFGIFTWRMTAAIEFNIRRKEQ